MIKLSVMKIMSIIIALGLINTPLNIVSHDFLSSLNSLTIYEQKKMIENFCSELFSGRPLTILESEDYFGSVNEIEDHLQYQKIKEVGFDNEIVNSITDYIYATKDFHLSLTIEFIRKGMKISEFNNTKTIKVELLNSTNDMNIYKVSILNKDIDMAYIFSINSIVENGCLISDIKEWESKKSIIYH